MRLKWYISTLIITLSLFTTLCKEQTVVPNQEIVLQFEDVNVTSTKAQNTVAVVKAQLKKLGANSLQVTTNVNAGTLKIAYYSDVAVNQIKKELASQNQIDLDFPSKSKNENQSGIPLKKDGKSFNFDVYKIQDSQNSSRGLEGKLAIALKLESDRFFNSNYHNFAIVVDSYKSCRQQKVAYKLSRIITIVKNNTSHNIPEVRAGPITV